MTSDEQVILAQRLAAALAGAGLEVVAHHQEGGRGTYRHADMVSVVGLRELDTSDVVPMRPRLVRE